jgi:RNA polymerase sigma-70 factor (sigma-E family)
LDFEDFVAATSTRLFSLAMLLVGRNQADAEDLLQDVLERAYRHWPRIVRGGEPEPYIRRMLANAAVDRRRLLRRRPERPLDPGAPADTNEVDQVTERAVLIRALADLPPRQRAVLVLRYFEDLTEAQTAAVLGCGVGTVKSQSSRALARIRESAGLAGGAAAMPKAAGGDG